MDSQVFLVVGKDPYLAERARGECLSQIRSRVSEGEQLTVTTMTAAELSDSELLEALSPSLFGDDRVTVITGADAAGSHAQELLLHAAVDPGPGIYLIVEHSGGGRAKTLATKLAKIATVVRVDPPAARELPGWVNAEFQRHGRRVTPDVVRALLEGVGSDLRELASAVAQLVSDVTGDIEVADVRSYYSGVAEVSSFDIADWAVSGQLGLAVASTRRALQLGMSPVAIAAALSSKVSLIARLYSTRGRVDSKALATKVGAHPFVVEKTQKVARRWSAEQVSTAVIAMADLDAEVKGQGGDPDYAIEAAVARIARLAS